MLTCGILNNLKRLATCIDVTLEAAPKTPEILLCLIVGDEPSGHLYVPSSILLIEPINIIL